ncbi:hypothetical protein TWF696_005926 [Orbilia brochopaga]|uniref:C2H2-type domain-containing protein n=1 Tax=Orbilia brochopaga TaxID=3140254 RepID=A0AAV9UVI9_9PEZI
MASSSRSARPMQPEIQCPLCDYTADHESIIQMHFDAIHPTPEPPPPPPRPKPKPKTKQEQLRSLFRAPTVEENDAYDPFKYQIPNNNSQEIVGHPVYRTTNGPVPPPTRAPPPVPIPTPVTAPAPTPMRVSVPTSAPRPATRPAPTLARVATPVAEPEPEYVTCEWRGCGEPVSLLQLEEHIAMHEEMVEAGDDEDEDDLDVEENVSPKSSVAAKREKEGEALMEAATRKRHITKKEGPSDRLRKKLGKRERRIEKQLAQDETEMVMQIEDEGDLVTVQKVEKDDHNRQSDDDETTSNEYEIISKTDLEEAGEEEEEEEEEEKPKKKGKSEKSSSKNEHRGHHHHHHPGKKLQKQYYGGYSFTEPLFSLKFSSSSSSSSSTPKPKFKKSELGPYANEKRMPEWLKEALSAGGKEVFTRYIDRDGRVRTRKSYANETSGLIPVIRNLITLDPNVSKAYLCHSSVKHVFKEHNAANGFCGYRNIQMLASYCQKNHVPGCERLFGERIPSIIQIQQWIENAWDMGINAHARAETGGILYTRKYIGSSEVEAMFTSFGTSTIPRQFSEPNQQVSALRHAWNYFSNGYDEEQEQDKVVITERPPIYFQHHGHSMTIVGIERYNDGSLCFICFDPMFSPSQAIRGLIGQKRVRSNIAYGKLLRAFRRGGAYLKRYKIFEMVEFAASEPETSLYD